MNRFEKIQNMSLDELAGFLSKIDKDEISVGIKYCEKYCPLKSTCDVDLIEPDDCYDIDFTDSIKVWLQQEV